MNELGDKKNLNFTRFFFYFIFVLFFFFLVFWDLVEELPPPAGFQRTALSAVEIFVSQY